ncbi:hypothetical protein DEI83_11725 [Curtobacterium sp. MCBD17_021]|nr:hypothetical protein DEI83_11725 [Curtobacterium sp. MCBD17_021]
MVAVCAVLGMTGCTTSTGSDRHDVDLATVEEEAVSIVDRTASAVGGTWKVYSGPSVETCGDGAEDSARYVYIVERFDTEDTDPAADIQLVQDLWDAQGITTAAYRSGGTDPLLGMRGRGGPVTSIAFNAYPQRYSITALSGCADGDVAELREGQ